MLPMDFVSPRQSSKVEKARARVKWDYNICLRCARKINSKMMKD